MFAKQAQPTSKEIFDLIMMNESDNIPLELFNTLYSELTKLLEAEPNNVDCLKQIVGWLWYMAAKLKNSEMAKKSAVDILKNCIVGITIKTALDSKTRSHLYNLMRFLVKEDIGYIHILIRAFIENNNEDMLGTLFAILPKQTALALSTIISMGTASRIKIPEYVMQNVVIEHKNKSYLLLRGGEKNIFSMLNCTRKNFCAAIREKSHLEWCIKTSAFEIAFAWFEDIMRNGGKKIHPAHRSNIMAIYQKYRTFEGCAAPLAKYCMTGKREAALFEGPSTVGREKSATMSRAVSVYGFNTRVRHFHATSKVLLDYIKQIEKGEHLPSTFLIKTYGVCTKKDIIVYQLGLKENIASTGESNHYSKEHGMPQPKNPGPMIVMQGATANIPARTMPTALLEEGEINPVVDGNDDLINTFLQTMITKKLGGFANGCEFLLKQQTTDINIEKKSGVSEEEEEDGEENDDNKINHHRVFLPGVNESMIGYFIDKENQPAPVTGPDTRKDMFDEIATLLCDKDNHSIVIRQPLDKNSLHWCELEVKIVKEMVNRQATVMSGGKQLGQPFIVQIPKFRIQVAAKDFRSGRIYLDPTSSSILEEVYRRKIRSVLETNNIPHHEMNFETTTGRCPVLQDQGDIWSCPFILIDAIARQFISGPNEIAKLCKQPKFALKLRKDILYFMERNADKVDFNRIKKEMVFSKEQIHEIKKNTRPLLVQHRSSEEIEMNQILGALQSLGLAPQLPNSADYNQLF